MKIREIFETVASISSKKAKEDCLEVNMSPLLNQILNDTYNSKRYNIKKWSEPTSTVRYNIDENYYVFHNLLVDLTTGTLFGNAARMMVGLIISQFVEEDREWLRRIINKNLKIGAGEKFAEDSGAIKKMPVALAHSLKDAKNIDPIDGNWFVSRKLDGIRCLAIVEAYESVVDVKFFSRQGKQIQTLDNLKEAFWQLFRGVNGKWVVDGEVCVMEDGKEDFRGLMSLVTRKDYTIEHPYYNAFDLLTWDEFVNDKTAVTKFSERYQKLKNLYDVQTNGGMFGQDIDKVFNILNQERLETQDQLDAWQKRADESGWEGLMIRKDVPYEGKRTKNLLKIKNFKDAEYIVEGIIDGDLTYNTTNGSETIHGVSALVITHKGNRVKVGSGMTKEQRIEWFGDPSKIIGRTITVKYFEESRDSKTGMYSLRFPTLKFVYEGKREL